MLLQQSLTIFVTTTAAVDDDAGAVLQRRGELLEVCNSVASLQRRDDPFELTQTLKCIESLLHRESPVSRRGGGRHKRTLLP